jgi:hypothetical protein
VDVRTKIKQRGAHPAEDVLAGAWIAGLITFFIALIGRPLWLLAVYSVFVLSKGISGSPLETHEQWTSFAPKVLKSSSDWTYLMLAVVAGSLAGAIWMRNAPSLARTGRFAFLLPLLLGLSLWMLVRDLLLNPSLVPTRTLWYVGHAAIALLAGWAVSSALSKRFDS